jgi:hypothetical protein
VVTVGVGDVVVVGVGDVVVVGAVDACVAGDVVGGWDVFACVAGDVVGGWYVFACDDALADAFGCLLAVGEAEADALWVAAVAEETSAAGRDWVGVCPCEPRAKAAPAPPSTSTPMIATSTSGRRRRRGGGPSVPDGGSPGASGGEPLAGVDQASVAWYGGGVAAKSAIEVCVAAKPGTSGMGTAVGAGVPSIAVGAG